MHVLGSNEFTPFLIFSKLKSFPRCLYLSMLECAQGLALAQSDPDSQTAPYQARNTSSGCNAAPFHGRHTGFARGRVGRQFRIC